MPQSSNQEQAGSEDQDENHAPGSSSRVRLPPLFEDDDDDDQVDETPEQNNEINEQVHVTSDLSSRLQRFLDLRPSIPRVPAPTPTPRNTMRHLQLQASNIRRTDSIHPNRLLIPQPHNLSSSGGVVPQNRPFVSDEEKELALFESICEGAWKDRIARNTKAKGAAERRRNLGEEFNVIRAAAKKLRFEASMKFYQARGFLLVKELQLWAFERRRGWI